MGHGTDVMLGSPRGRLHWSRRDLRVDGVRVLASRLFDDRGLSRPGGSPVRRWRGLAVAVTVACAVAVGAAGSAAATSTTTTGTAPAKTTGPSSGLVAISPTRNMFLECQGTGSPTVVLIAGGLNSAAIWSMPYDFAKPGPTVYPEVSKFTRVCAYDRPGTASPAPNDQIAVGTSTPVTQSVTPANGVIDLHTLLEVAKVPGPYVLVAHSYGGMIARLYASTYPTQVAGLVLIDSPTEYFFDRLTVTQQEMWLTANSNPPVIPNGEEVNFPAAFAEMRAARPIRRVPAVVLTSDEVFDYSAAVDAGKLPPAFTDFGKLTFDIHVAAQRKLAKTLHAKLVLDTHSGHYIFVEQPELAIKSIHQVVDQVRRQH
jgi:pimeloyl-ACP methyl ester carboxylesterase